VRNDVGDVLVQSDVYMYHLMCFLRYAVGEHDFSSSWIDSRRRPVEAAADRSAAGSANFNFYSSQTSRWKSGNVYLSLLQRYFNFFFPIVADHRFSDHAASSSMSSQSELFLWLAVDYWIDSALIVRREFNKMSSLYTGARDVSVRMQQGQSQGIFLPKSPSDVLFLDFNRPGAPSLSMLQSTYLLVCHLQRAALSNGAEFLTILVTDALKSPLGKGPFKVGGGDGSSCHAMPRALSMLQQPLFDLLRSLFARFDRC
jgi:hypothetical protein